MPSRIVRFGTFQADLDSGELHREGIKLKLGGQPFQVLEYLLSRPGEVVTREELQVAVWQSASFGDFDHGLNTAINKIREALGDSATNPRFVETVPRRGYRFIAPVDQPVPIEPEAPTTTKRQSRNWIAAVAALIAAFAAGFILSRPRAAVPLEYKLSQITRNSGLTFQPAISDGNFIAYASDRGTGKDLDIWVQHVAGGEPVRLTASSAHEYFPSISADGRRIAFHRGYWGDEKGIFVVPVLGGTPKMVAPLGRDARISPDGTVIAYATGDYRQPSEIRLVSAEGGSDRKIPTGLDWAIAPIWTRDGKQLLLWSYRRHSARPDYWVVSASGGTALKTPSDWESQERSRCWKGLTQRTHLPWRRWLVTI